VGLLDDEARCAGWYEPRSPGELTASSLVPSKEDTMSTVPIDPRDVDDEIVDEAIVDQSAPEPQHLNGGGGR